MTHKQWLDNEYNQWAQALSECTVSNFKEHPMVKMMLGEPDDNIWGPVNYSQPVAESLNKLMPYFDLLHKIELIGYDAWKSEHDNFSRLNRYVYYAQQILKLNPPSICEIGGGVGQFYAILRALGYKGTYWIFDIPEVITFQGLYLNEVSVRTGLSLHQTFCKFDMIVSFYALGEFDDETKQHYAQLVSDCPHGYIAWNPHSGATDDLSIFDGHDITVTPGIEPGIKIIQW